LTKSWIRDKSLFVAFCMLWKAWTVFVRQTLVPRKKSDTTVRSNKKTFYTSLQLVSQTTKDVNCRPFLAKTQTLTKNIRNIRTNSHQQSISCAKTANKWRNLLNIILITYLFSLKCMIRIIRYLLKHFKRNTITTKGKQWMKENCNWVSFEWNI